MWRRMAVLLMEYNEGGIDKEKCGTLTYMLPITCIKEKTWSKLNEGCQGNVTFGDLSK